MQIGFHFGFIVAICFFGTIGFVHGFLSCAVSPALARPFLANQLRSRQWLEMMNDDDNDDDDDEPPDVDITQFSPPKSSVSYGPGRGRSAPSQRKAMGTSGSSSTSVHVCTNCGAEFVKWMGRCPTCREWNTLQEFKVDRGESSTKGRPSFAGGSTSFSAKPSSWLDGARSSDFENQPVRVTDVYREVKKNGGDIEDYVQKMKRIQVPNDDEINTVLGGGIMSGSLTLIGGDPGVGKSTLMLQMAGAVASMSTPSRGIGMGAQPTDSKKSLGPVWYISGEENPDQIALRAARLGIFEAELWILSETHVDTLAEQVIASYHQIEKTTNQGEVIPGQEAKPPALLIIDSIQTMVCESAGHSAAGGVTQVRECVALFLRLSKSTGIPIFLVGHVTKSGDVAGPRTIEHMVDCVLYLEGGDMSTIGGVNLRMLRAAKNRFGSSDEVGVYEMTTGRLMPVSDPSSLFLSNRVDADDSEGCAIAIALEGLRAVTVEVQALVSHVAGAGSYGRRTVDGIDSSRLLLLLGVLQKRMGMYFSKQDVYINVVGRTKLDRNAQEGHASDLAVAISVVSSFMSTPVRGDTAFVGEVGLLGELRPVPAMEKRVQEARRMGFSRVITPRTGKGRKKGGPSKPSFSRAMGIDWIQCDTLSDAVNEGLVVRLPKGRRKIPPSLDADNVEAPPRGVKSPGTLAELMLDHIITDDAENDNDWS